MTLKQSMESLQLLFEPVVEFIFEGSALSTYPLKSVSMARTISVFALCTYSDHVWSEENGVWTV